QDSYISISGYLAHPQFSANSMQKQYIFLNNRPISDRTVSASVKDSYGSLLEKTRYPVFMLFLTIPHEAVDVNVHPRKEQVSFVNQDSVSAFIRSAVTQTLAKYNLGFTSPLSNIYSPRAGTTQSESAQMLREEEALWNVKDPLLLIDTIPIQQIHDTYLVVQTKSGVVIIDQHAAHERILYEQLLSSYTKKIQDKYVLKNPVSLELTASEKEVITEYHSVFVTAGFDIRKKGKSMVVHAIPKLFKDRDLLQLIRELADDLSQKGTVTVIDSVSHTMITYLACRGAIKAGDKLTQNEAKRLIEKLAQTPNNATCPHGRPTRIELPIRELHTWFKRE
ncbi:MAG TPA: hypothetical protein PLD54_02745, partial [Candidatus Levybacteria bacterium]|nr:hypothetical protein [Candidatus Levybacteria bacterium]